MFCNGALDVHVYAQCFHLNFLKLRNARLPIGRTLLILPVVRNASDVDGLFRDVIWEFNYIWHSLGLDDLCPEHALSDGMCPYHNCTDTPTLKGRRTGYGMCVRAP